MQNWVILVNLCNILLHVFNYILFHYFKICQKIAGYSYKHLKYHLVTDCLCISALGWIKKTPKHFTHVEVLAKGQLHIMFLPNCLSKLFQFFKTFL